MREISYGARHEDLVTLKRQNNAHLEANDVVDHDDLDLAEVPDTGDAYAHANLNDLVVNYKDTVTLPH